MKSATAVQAEQILDSQFETIGSVTKYIRAFQTRRGRELAIERERDGVYVWTEQVGGYPEGLPVPESYDAKRSRNSNLNGKAKRLQAGKPAFYWRLSDTDELQRLCGWYVTA